METKTFEVKDLDPAVHKEIQIGKKNYLYAGSAYSGSDMMIVNFFLGPNDARFGKLIVPGDFPIEVVKS